MKTRTEEWAKRNSLKKEKIDAIRRTAVESILKSQRDKPGTPSFRAGILPNKVELFFILKSREVSLVVTHDNLITNVERIFAFVKDLDDNAE